MQTSSEGTGLKLEFFVYVTFYFCSTTFWWCEAFAMFAKLSMSDQIRIGRYFAVCIERTSRAKFIKGRKITSTFKSLVENTEVFTLV